MNLLTKGDLVNAALRKAAIASNSTLTDVEPASVEDALNDLEMMMHEWLLPEYGIDLGYEFSLEGEPVLTSDEHKLPNYSMSAVVHNLAVRILPDYVREASPSLLSKASFGKEQLIKHFTKEKSARLCYPDRMPIGSGNRYWAVFGNRYYRGRRNG